MKAPQLTRWATVLVTLLLHHFGQAQYFPSGGDSLNYTVVMFGFPWVEGAAEYEILVQNPEVDGDIYAKSEANKVLISGLEFDSEYVWKVRGITSLGEKMRWSEEQHFSTGYSEFIDTEKYRYPGKKVARDKADPGLLFFDYAKVGVNRAGKPYWFLPKLDSVGPKTRIRDLKMTSTGTFTMLYGFDAIETDRDGNILWKAPNSGEINGEEFEFYHHELNKLPNGNYMVIGKDHVMRRVPGTNDSVNVELATIIEYDPENNEVWSWKSNDYFTDDILFSQRDLSGNFDTRTHMNACTTNGEFVFAGFRDVSRILVIDKKTKEVVESYGGTAKYNEPHGATGFFRRQHDAHLLSDGNMAVFNNDSVMDPQVVSSVVVFSRLEDGVSRKIMDFKVDFDTLTDGKSEKTGNLNEMRNGNIIAYLGSINRCIEITRSGEVVWSMFLEQYDTRTNAWREFPQYRVCYAASLYPYEFTSRQMGDKLQKRKREVTIRVYNVGNEKDQYTVTCMRKSKQMAAETIQIEGNSHADVTLRVKTKSALKVNVASRTLDEIQEMKIAGYK